MEPRFGVNYLDRGCRCDDRHALEALQRERVLIAGDVETHANAVGVEAFAKQDSVGRRRSQPEGESFLVQDQVGGDGTETGVLRSGAAAVNRATT